MLCLLLLGFFERQALARLAIVAGVEALGHVRLSFSHAEIGIARAAFTDARVTSFRDEPIAEIGRLDVSYDLRDLLPGGKRLFGVQSLDADRLRVTLIRHADGTYNVPISNFNANATQPGAPPLVLHARLTNGSIDVIDESRLAFSRQLYVRNLRADADISSENRSNYRVAFRYGERRDALFPVNGNGTIDLTRNFIDQHWTAAQLPVAGAANFLLDSPSLRMQAGTLRRFDARYFGFGGSGTLRPHLAATATFTDGRIAIAGLSKPVLGVNGPADLYDDGLLTSGLRANVGGIPATIAGGVYGLRDPRLRVAVRGSGDVRQLRTILACAQRLPVTGPIAFALLIEGSAKAPLTWVSLRSPRTTYAATSLTNVSALAAFDGHQADVVAFHGEYGSAHFNARGRIALDKEPNAIELMVRAGSPPGGAPYLDALLPQASLDAVAVATAKDPRAIALRGALWGGGGNESLDGIFNVDERGNGTVGPLIARGGNGTLYARVVLDRAPGASSIGILAVRDFPLAAARGTLDATFAGTSSAPGTIAGVGAASLAGAWGAAHARAGLAIHGGALRGTIVGDLGSQGSFGAMLGGTTYSPDVDGTVVIADGRYRNFDVNGNAGLAYRNGTLDIHDAAAAVGPLFVGVDGTIRGLSAGNAVTPRYDLAAQLHSSDVSTLVATVAPQKAPLIQGSVDADIRVAGSANTPAFAGQVRVPEGSVNGLDVRDFSAGVRGDPSAVTVSDGRVVVGSSAIDLNATVNRAGAAGLALRAPRVDLADFNDFFDAGDMFAGTGSLALQAQTIGGRVLSSSGDATFVNAKWRRLDLGSVAARWKAAGNSVATSLRFGSPSGEVALHGTIAPASQSGHLVAIARHVDLATWLPMLGYNAPITGRLDLDTTFSGRYPDLNLQAHATVTRGTVGRVPIERFDVSASSLHGYGRLTSAALDVPSMTTVASGTFGLRAGDPLALTVTSSSADIGDFLNRAAGTQLAVRGALVSTLHVAGTRAAPRLRDDIELHNVRYNDLTVPRIAGEVDANRSSIGIRDVEFDLDRGKALLSASAPITFGARGITLRNGGAISGSLVADGVDLSDAAGLLPKQTNLRGQVNGRIDLAGTFASPTLLGALTVSDGTFAGPMERTPITGIAGTLTFTGTRAILESHALIGSGRLTASGVASIPDLRPADATLSFNLRATEARLDMPAYFQGTVSGAVAMVRAPGSLPSLSGDLAMSHARLPLSAFLTLNKAGPSQARSLDVAFDNLQLTAGPDVRVQSANVDIGATGAVRLGGTLGAPTLAGGFHSTGGSLTFYRAFNIERGDVRFDPADGLIPNVDAVATTFVPNPATAIRLQATGAVTNMNLALASDPPYSRQQILGLLVGAQQFGAVQGVQSTGGGGLSATSAVQNVAKGQLNAAFTRTLLEPISASVGSALGFNEVQITSDLQTGVGVNASKTLGKYVTAIFRQTFGYPQTQSVGLEAHPNPETGLRLTAYSSTGPTLFALQQPQPAAANVLNVNPATSFTPINGSSGVSFSYVRRWW